MGQPFTYYRNNFVSFGKDIRLWLPSEVQRYNYKITYGSVSTLNMSVLGNGFYRSTGIFYSPGGLYQNVKKDKMILPGMFAAFISSHLYTMIKMRRAITFIYRYIISTHRYVHSIKSRRRALNARLWHDFANRINKHRVHRKPTKTSVLDAAINAARLLNIGFYFRRIAFDRYDRRKGYYTAFFCKRLRWKSFRRQERRERRMYKVYENLYYSCMRETYRCIDFVYKIPQSVLSLRSLDGFYEYCKYIYRKVYRSFPDKDLDALLQKHSNSAYRKQLRNRTRYRKPIRKSLEELHLFDVFSGNEWHNMVMTQSGLKPHKWYFSTIKKHRQYDLRRNKFVPRQAKYHIEERYHGQVLDFESIIGRTLELSKVQVYKFFQKVIKRESVYKLGLLLHALNKRLDLYLRKYFPQLNLSRIRGIIRSGAILVNDTRISDIHYSVDTCDVIQFDMRTIFQNYNVPIFRGVDFMYNHYFITLFFTLYGVRNFRLRNLLKSNLIIIFHRMLRTWLRTGRKIRHVAINSRTRYLNIKYWRIGSLNDFEYVVRERHWEHPYELRRKRQWSRTKYNAQWSTFFDMIRTSIRSKLPRTTKQRRNYVLRYLYDVLKKPLRFTKSRKVRYVGRKRRKRYLRRSAYHRMLWSPIKQRRIKRRGRFGTYHVNRTKVPLQRVLSKTNISSRVENEMHKYSMFAMKTPTWYLPKTEYVARVSRLLSNFESVVYVAVFARFFHTKLSVYVNPIFISRTLTFRRMVRISHGVTFVRRRNAAKRARRIARIGRATLHTGHSFWDRLLDNLYVALQLMLPTLLVESLHTNNYLFFIRHDLDIAPEYVLQRRQRGLFTLPITAHSYANALMFKRFVYDKARIRRSFAHSPFVTSRRMLFGPNRDTYSNYV